MAANRFSGQARRAARCPVSGKRRNEPGEPICPPQAGCFPGSFRPKLNHSDGAILCQDQAQGTQRVSIDTGKFLSAETGSKAPVPSGFQLAGAQSRTGLGRCAGIALHPAQSRIAAPIEKQNCFNLGRKGPSRGIVALLCRCTTSPWVARLATAKNHPGQMVPFGRVGL